MDLDDFVSPGLDTKLKCFVCQNYLSYFPISLCSNNQSVCGRCEIPEATIAFRNEAFEDLGKLIKFPCRYQSEGCLEALLPEDIPEHEEDCEFRVIPCAISKPNRCEWNGSLKILTQHCHEEHSDVILKNDGFMMDLSVSGECDSLLEHNGLLYIFTRKFSAESKTLYCAIYNPKHETAESVSAIVTIKTGNKKVSLDLMMTSFEDFVYTELCFLSLVTNNQEENVASCKVELQEEEEYRFDEKMNSALLSMLKCCVCSEFASPSPIYRSYNDTTTLKTVCSSCEECVDDPERDMDLEKIASLVKYPCKYQESGCTFISVNSTKLQHEAVCQYRTIDCPLVEFNKSCTWKGLVKDISDHVSNNHQEITFSSGYLRNLLKDDTLRWFVFLRASDRLFQLKFSYIGPRFLWSVQSINCCEEDIKYQVDIVGNRDGGKLLMRRNCSKQSEGQDVFKDLSKCCYFENTQIYNFENLSEENEVSLKFRVRLIK